MVAAPSSIVFHSSLYSFKTLLPDASRAPKDFISSSDKFRDKSVTMVAGCTEKDLIPYNFHLLSNSKEKSALAVFV